MSNKELDSLFKNKLETISREPKSDSWTKIQGELGNKEKKEAWFYMRIAAAILLLITFGSIYWLSSGDKITKPVVADNTPVIKETDTKENANPIDSVTISPAATVPLIAEMDKSQYEVELNAAKTTTAINKEKDTSEKSKGQVVTKQSKKNIPKNNKYNRKLLEIIPDTFREKVATNEAKRPDQQNTGSSNKKNELIKSTDATVQIATASTEQKHETTGSTQVFDIEDFDMKKAVAEVDPGTNKRKGLRRVLDLVKEVKNGEKGLSDLRESKNELLNLKRNKNDNSK